MTHISSDAALAALKSAAALLPPGSTITLSRETILAALPVEPAKEAPVTTDQPQADRWLNAKDVAAILRASPRFVYQHASEFPFLKRLPGGAMRFSEQGLRHWMRRNG